MLEFDTTMFNAQLRGSKCGNGIVLSRSGHFNGGSGKYQTLIGSKTPKEKAKRARMTSEGPR